MLSHLRFHRRAPSNPTSPLPDPPATWEAAATPDSQHADDVPPRASTRPPSSNSVNAAPMLPPIPRVTSDTDLSFEGVQNDGRLAAQSPPGRPAYDGGSSGFLGGVTLQNFRRGHAEPLPDSRGKAQSQVQLPESLLSRAKPPPPPINTGFFRPSLSKPPKSFVAPTDLPQNNGGATGKRPAGTRLVSEPTPNSTAPPVPEAQKGKKGLPFLKNPMSTLLMRRKTAQNASEVQPLPFSEGPSYDPRIRGTRVHDFSAPRPRRIISTTESTPNLTKAPSRATESGQLPPQGVAEVATGPSAERSEVLSPVPEDQGSPEQSVPPVPPKDGPVASLRTSSSLTSRAPSVGTSRVMGSTSSVRTTASRNVSVSGSSIRDSSFSALPKHMKSTSSRFSFDMIGAANQEKLLEDRHRQREQERKTPDSMINGQRDSRFDDLDDDGFDYDAMMEDDGLEERIPGVNADYDEDDFYEEEIPGVNADYNEEDELSGGMDPDNDQENFAGFVFQRSNPASSLASPYTPGMLATPRDAEGKAIGFAMTKDTTPDLPPTTSPLFFHDLTLPPKSLDGTHGLGIQDLNINPPVVEKDPVSLGEHSPAPADPPPPKRNRDDDLYFDEGLADELDFTHDGPTFDESIFDLNDTDQYGRPIPGAFAQAQEAMRAAQRQPSIHESDVTSPSGISESTAPTSVDAGPQPTTSNFEEEASGSLLPPDLPAELMQKLAIVGQDFAYQAALAEAAQKAAASGKFRRSSSPPLPAELTVTSPTDSHVSRGYDDLDASLDDYEVDPYSNNIDDYELDDDAIIAEANASALANDSDGWYGQEFGFYSAPMQQPHHGHHSSSSSNGSNALSAENLFQYANGGFFGPPGQSLNRTTSGRVVSREPNLTPITERSEYSNRNSIMSLTLPPPLGGDGRASAAGMHSPGLAQLAMLSSDDDNMSLAALMRLRSRTWGGSQASSREGSPRSERASGLGDPASSPWHGPGSSGFLGPASHGHHGHGRKGSQFSLWSSSDAGESGAGSPTLLAQSAPLTLPLSSPLPMQAMFSPQSAHPSPLPHAGTACSPVLEGEEGEYDHLDGSLGSPEPPSSPGLVLSSPSQQRRPGMGHRHKGSADSISYVKEEEPESGGTRWVLERRRTGESGEVEILGREVVEGGRI
ncbi:hypothetical protein OQA88_1816 [Cercophora sp. LCS_1]